jgi:hypothetical protein
MKASVLGIVFVVAGCVPIELKGYCFVFEMLPDEGNLFLIVRVLDHDTLNSAVTSW